MAKEPQTAIYMCLFIDVKFEAMNGKGYFEWIEAKWDGLCVGGNLSKLLAVT